MATCELRKAIGRMLFCYLLFWERRRQSHLPGLRESTLELGFVERTMDSQRRKKTPFTLLCLKDLGKLDNVVISRSFSSTLQLYRWEK
jgi:hypothetical protein